MKRTEISAVFMSAVMVLSFGTGIGAAAKESADVNPEQMKTVIDGFRGYTWGTVKEEAVAEITADMAEGEDYEAEIDSAGIYYVGLYAERLAGHAAEALFFFDDDVLTGGGYLVEDFEDAADDLYRKYLEVYGEPSVENEGYTVWTDSESNLVLFLAPDYFDFETTQILYCSSDFLNAHGESLSTLGFKEIDRLYGPKKTTLSYDGI